MDTLNNQHNDQSSPFEQQNIRFKPRAKKMIRILRRKLCTSGRLQVIKVCLAYELRELFYGMQFRIDLF